MAKSDDQQSILYRIASLFGGRAGPRQTRLYCVGAPRTGTHSLAAVFDRSIRAKHEPKLRAAMQQVIAHHRGELDDDGLRAFVRRRDQRLRLELDSSHVNAFLLAPLLAEFDDARFVLTMRDCRSWLDSALNHTMNTANWSGVDRQYLEFWFGTLQPEYSRHDAFLREHGLLSVDCYLAAWARHNEAVLATVPDDRLLVVRTDRIAERLEEIAAFAGVPKDRIARGFRAQGQARVRHGMLGRVDAAYVDERVDARCGDLMRRFFPDATLPA